jgi:ribosomal-protein-alanine N-acetyltransferase
MISLRTARLELIAGTADMVRAEMLDREKFARLLNASVPTNWPSEGNDNDSQAFFLNHLDGHPERVGWLCWYVVLFTDPSERVVVGGCGFKGEPTQDGEVEIGYAILSQYQRKGYASEAIGAMLKWAFAHREVNRILAEAMFDNAGSIRALESCGFSEIGAGSEPGLIRFSQERAAYQSHSNSSIE